MSDVVAIKDQVEAAVQAALSQVLPAELAGTDPVVRLSSPGFCGEWVSWQPASSEAAGG